jgi:acylphosphatase
MKPTTLTTKLATESATVFMKRVHVYISGRVQGVFFRAETKDTARAFNLTGWVRNMSDGRVEALFEGKKESVDKMIAWCHIGPPAARVEKVMYVEETYTGEFPDFSVKY